MIDTSDVLASVLSRSYTFRVRAQSWLGPDLLSDNVPIAAGTEDVDRTMAVPERVTLTVPRHSGGFNWTPATDDHPLGANGQRLHIELGVDISLDQTEWLSRGWFLIDSADDQGDAINVTCTGLLSLISEARLIGPFQPSGTIAATLRKLVEPALTLDISAALIDRSVPAGINYSDDRLQAFLDVLDAWPADCAVTEDGFLSVFPAVQSTTPVLTLTDGVGGTVITASGSTTRDGAFNVVVAEGTAADGGQIQASAFALSGPKAYGGYFNPLPVPFFYASPLLTTVAQCRAAANTVLARKQRAITSAFTVTMVPDPRVQVGDVVTVVSTDYGTLLCNVEALQLPYTAGGGAMTLTVRQLP